MTKRNTDRTRSRAYRVPNELVHVHEAARRDRKQRFTALLHHVTPALLRKSFESLSKSAAAGVDGVTWHAYAENLGDNLGELHGRLHRGAYRARPTRRTYIPKGDGQERPLGIAAVEDKIVQKAFVTVLNTIYEVDFLGFSYGFRPGRSQHDALDAVHEGICGRKVNWVLDADIRGFFDAIDHEWLMRFVEHRIGDKRVLRYIRKWLNAGMMEGGRWTPSGRGTPQGATMSPLLANVYLHYVLDLWTDQWRKRHAKGDVIIVRYADDFIVGFQHQHDAERYQNELKQRLQQFALELHPDKTRLLEFGRFAASNHKDEGRGKPETFDFLGLRHICSRDRKGKFQLRRKTVPERMRSKLKHVKAELMRRRHTPIAAQGAWLRRVVQGHLNYYAVPLNTRALRGYVRAIRRHWMRALRRRSQRHRMPWKRFERIATRWLPKPRVLHPWPSERLGVNTRGRSPVR